MVATWSQVEGHEIGSTNSVRLTNVHMESVLPMIAVDTWMFT